MSEKKREMTMEEKRARIRAFLFAVELKKRIHIRAKEERESKQKREE